MGCADQVGETPLAFDFREWNFYFLEGGFGYLLEGRAAGQLNQPVAAQAEPDGKVFGQQALSAGQVGEALIGRHWLGSNCREAYGGSAGEQHRSRWNKARAALAQPAFCDCLGSSLDQQSVQRGHIRWRRPRDRAAKVSVVGAARRATSNDGCNVAQRRNWPLHGVGGGVAEHFDEQGEDELAEALLGLGSQVLDSCCAVEDADDLALFVEWWGGDFH